MRGSKEKAGSFYFYYTVSKDDDAEQRTMFEVRKKKHLSVLKSIACRLGTRTRIKIKLLSSVAGCRLWWYVRD